MIWDYNISQEADFAVSLYGGLNFLLTLRSKLNNCEKAKHIHLLIIYNWMSET